MPDVTIEPWMREAADKASAFVESDSAFRIPGRLRLRLQDIIATAYAAREQRPSTNRRKITLCGSTRFKRAWLEWNARLTLEGNVVLTVAMWSHSVRIEPTPEQKVLLDEIHKAKIDDSDEIFVLDCGGYIGSSTRSEIEHAEKTGKRVRYLSKEHPAWTEDDCTFAAREQAEQVPSGPPRSRERGEA